MAASQGRADKGPPETAGQIQFEEFTRLLDTIVRTPAKNGKKVKVLRRFCDKYLSRRDGNDLFHFYRLLLPSPQVDKERGNYQLKEAKLAAALAGAVGASGGDTERAKQWRSLNTSRSGLFHEVMYEVLFRKYLREDQGGSGPGLALEEVNHLLDELANRAGDAAGQQALLRALLQRCSPGAARWLVLITLRDMKLGMSADTVLAAYHPDAPDVLNGCMDLRQVLVELIDPNTRVKKKDVVPGQPAKPQLADRCDGGVAVAAKRMRGRRFVVEVKFDGERMQVHRTGPSSFNFFSRRGLDHGSRRDFTVLGPALEALMPQERMILDGEMVVWNKTRQVFEPFGGLTSALDAINRGAGPQERIKMKMGTAINTSDPDYIFPTASDVEVVYVAFDVLFIDGGSVLDKPLWERHQLLRRALRPCPPEGIPVGPSGVIRFRALALLPEAPMLGGEVYSKEGSGEEDIKDVYERALAKQEEGIVVKALDSPYKLNDRSGTWLKVKPDYVDSSEFDAVIIGAMWGTGGRRGGRLSEFLLALADTPRIPGAEPSTFVSFCRVGTGLSAEQYDLVRELLRPLLVELGPGQRPPRCYRVTGHTRERPDVWVRDPLRSVVLTVKADVRTITSDTFATRYSLRFPRVVAVREDRSARDATTLAELERMVMERGRLGAEGTEADRGGGAGGHGFGRGGRDGTGAGGGGGSRRRAGGPSKGGPPRVAVAKVPLALRLVDVSQVAVEDDVLGGRYVLLRDCPGDTRRQLAALIKKLGGKETQNFVPSGPLATSHVILGRWEPGGRKDPWVMQVGSVADLLRPQWLHACAAERKLLEPPRPSLAWSICEKTRQQFSELIDPYCDPYFELLAEEDLAAVLERHVTAEQLAAARAELEEAAAMPARARRRARQQDARRQPDGRTTLYETTNDVVRRIREEIHEIGEKPPPGSMFLGLTLLFLELHDILPPPTPPTRAAAPLGLLAGVADCEARAHQWTAADPRDRVEALKAAVVRHGGVVVDAWDERVTHLVVYDGLDEQDEELRRVIEAERGAALPCGEGGGGAAAAAVARVFRPEEIIEALIGVAECAADEDAADEDEADGPGGEGGEAGPTQPSSLRRGGMSSAQARCLSLIRAALERPRGMVEAVGAVQLVDWRWVRDSLQRAAAAAAADAAAAAARAARRAAAAAAAAAGGLVMVDEDEEEEEGAQGASAVGASAVGHLSELDYPPRISMPQDRLAEQQQPGQHQQQEQQELDAVLLEAEAEAEAGAEAALEPAGQQLRIERLPQQVEQRLEAEHKGPDQPPPAADSVARAPEPGGLWGARRGQTGATLGSLWRSVLYEDSDEDELWPAALWGPGPAAGTAGAAAAASTARASVGTSPGAGPLPDPSPGLQHGGAGALRGTGGALAGLQAPHTALPLPLPPPDEFIRYWPWERFQIGLPGPEELARLGTHHRRRRLSRDGTTGTATATGTGSTTTDHTAETGAAKTPGGDGDTGGRSEDDGGAAGGSGGRAGPRGGRRRRPLPQSLRSRGQQAPAASGRAAAAAATPSRGQPSSPVSPGEAAATPAAAARGVRGSAAASQAAATTQQLPASSQATLRGRARGLDSGADASRGRGRGRGRGRSQAGSEAVVATAAAAAAAGEEDGQGEVVGGSRKGPSASVATTSPASSPEASLAPRRRGRAAASAATTTIAAGEGPARGAPSRKRRLARQVASSSEEEELEDGKGYVDEDERAHAQVLRDGAGGGRKRLRRAAAVAAAAATATLLAGESEDDNLSSVVAAGRDGRQQGGLRQIADIVAPLMAEALAVDVEEMMPPGRVQGLVSAGPGTRLDLGHSAVAAVEERPTESAARAEAGPAATVVMAAGDYGGRTDAESAFGSTRLLLYHGALGADAARDAGASSATQPAAGAGGAGDVRPLRRLPAVGKAPAPARAPAPDRAPAPPSAPAAEAALVTTVASSAAFPGGDKALSLAGRPGGSASDAPLGGQPSALRAAQRGAVSAGAAAAPAVLTAAAIAGAPAVLAAPGWAADAAGALAQPVAARKRRLQDAVRAVYGVSILPLAPQPGPGPGAGASAASAGMDAGPGAYGAPKDIAANGTGSTLVDLGHGREAFPGAASTTAASRSLGSETSTLAPPRGAPAGAPEAPSMATERPVGLAGDAQGGLGQGLEAGQGVLATSVAQVATTGGEAFAVRSTGGAGLGAAAVMGIGGAGGPVGATGAGAGVGAGSGRPARSKLLARLLESDDES